MMRSSFIARFSSPLRPARLIVAATLGLIVAPTLICADSMPREIVTRNQAGPVIVWDATPQIAGFIARDVAFNAALRALKVGALEIFVRASQGFAKSERHLSVMVVYARTGATNPRYQTKSFEGVADVLTLEGSPNVHFEHDWRTRAQRGQFPPGISIEVSDKLQAGLHAAQ